MTKYILFDLDDTIFDFKRSEAFAISQTMQKLGVMPSAFLIARYSEINDLMWKKLERGEMTRDEVLTLRFEKFFGELGITADFTKVRTFYEKTLGTSYFFIDGAEQMLGTLCKKYDLYIVSNGTASVQKGRLERSGVGKYFKGVFISQALGFNKPDVRFFEKASEQIQGFKKEEAVIIGDSLTSDIAGGKNFGIKTVWYSPHGKESDLPDITVRSFEEILSIF